MNEPRSTLCTRPGCSAAMLADGTVCWTCTQAGILDLGTVADWGTELITALTRQTRIGRGENHSTGQRDENPLPVDLRISELHSELHHVLAAWTERIRRALDLWTPRPAWPLCAAAETTLCAHDSCRSIVNDPQKATLSLADMARLLADHPRWIRRQDDAGRVLDVLDRAASRMVKALDLPLDMVGLGPCDSDDCSEVLRSPRDQAYVTCRGCGAVYSVDQRREARLRRADGLRATPSLLAVVLSDIYAAEHGIVLTRNTITQWDTRDKKLHRRGTTASGQAKYRVGDVRALYLAMINQRLNREFKSRTVAVEKTKQIAVKQAPRENQAA